MTDLATLPAPTLAIGDEVIFPAWNPNSGFVSRIVSIAGDMALCEPVLGGPSFPVELSKLRLNRTEGS
jgi:hypothetical protein